MSTHGPGKGSDQSGSAGKAGPAPSAPDEHAVAVGTGAPGNCQGNSPDYDGTQRDSGGSGGSELAGSQSGAARPEAGSEQAADEPGSAMTAPVRGPQDTRSAQAGLPGPGLGAPETGANQQPGDLAPGKRK
ncbi:MAG: hypothetical protein Q8R69_02770 [Telluria sp.]|nr:hypothetical protein [Telluria sp.]